MNYPELLKNARVKVKGAWGENYSCKLDSDGFIIESTKVESKKITE